MRFHWLGHVPFEDAASIGVWAEQHGHTVTSTRLYADEPLPAANEIDALAIMGGPMNVYQYRRYPWLLREKRFIDHALRVEIPIMGVCLGAQLLADVLGAKVTENPHIEIGWFPVRMVDAADASCLLGGPPERFTAFHWHGDTFEIPFGATRLAESDVCANQAFVYGASVVGLQFHLEYSQDSIRKMLAHCGDELVDAPFVQTRNQILAGLPHLGPATQRLFAFLDRWCP